MSVGPAGFFFKIFQGRINANLCMEFPLICSPVASANRAIRANMKGRDFLKTGQAKAKTTKLYDGLVFLVNAHQLGFAFPVCQ